MGGFNSTSPHLFAHRGGNGAGINKENTLAAFKAAVNLGYDFLETDVIVTRDGQVVTYHGSANFFMKRIFGLEIRRKAQRLTYSQFKKKIKLGGEEIPRFADVLDRFGDTRFSVDVKTNQAIGPLVEVIKKSKAQERVIITSFSKKRSIRANKLLYGEGFKNACFCVYRLKGILISIFPALVLSRLKSQGFSYIHIPYRCVSKKLLQESKKRDFKIYAWTVNKEDEIKKLLSWKIDGIISDDAELLIKFKKHL